MTIAQEIHETLAQLDQQLLRRQIPDDQAAAIAGELRRALAQLDGYHQVNPQDDHETRIRRPPGQREPGDEAFLEAWNEEGTTDV